MENYASIHGPFEGFIEGGRGEPFAGEQYPLRALGKVGDGTSSQKKKKKIRGTSLPLIGSEKQR